MPREEVSGRMSFVVVTNSARAKAEYEGRIAVEYVDGTPLDALERAGLLLRRNHRLLTAPLPPNIPMMRAPFRSLLLERTEGTQGDARGILAVEKARETMRTQRAIAASDERTGKRAEDFAVIDLDLLKQALRGLSENRA